MMKEYGFPSDIRRQGNVLYPAWFDVGDTILFVEDWR